MQYANEIFFAVVAIVLWGLTVSGKPFIQLKQITHPEGYWFLALICTASSFTFFAFASILQLGLLAPANTLLLAGYIYLASYCRSLTRPLTNQFKYLTLIAIVLIGLTFTYLLLRGTFIQRVSFVVTISCLAFVWQLIELQRLRKFHIKLPVFLIVTIIAELIFALARLVLLFTDDSTSSIHLYKELFLTAAVRWVWFAFTMLSYVAVIGYRVERVSAESMQSTLENNVMKLALAQQKAEQSELQFLATLNALAKARDNETGNHIIRTQNYVRILASRLMAMGHYTNELTVEVVELLFRAAPLHDIGKVGIPDSILLKPGRLTDEEWQVMKTHATIGEAVLSSAEQESPEYEGVIRKAFEIAGGHHEKWDGTGYPRRLRGEEIPLSARIMALADVYDALVSSRIYKPGWSHEAAINEILSNKGHHFDPLVVDAFIHEADRFLAISLQYKDVS